MHGECLSWRKDKNRRGYLKIKHVLKDGFGMAELEPSKKDEYSNVSTNEASILEPLFGSPLF